MSKVLHLISTGIRGGQESLLTAYMKNSRHENTYCCLYIRGPILDELRLNGFEVMDISDKSLSEKRQIISDLVKNETFDVFVNHSYIGKTVFVLNSLDFNNIGLIQYLHSAHEPKLLKAFQKTPLHYLTTKRIYKKAKKCIAISEYVKKSHEASFGRIRNCDVVYNGVDCLRFSAAADLNRPISKTLRLLYLGRITRIKGIHRIIEACSVLDSFGLDYRLDVVGRVVDKEYGEELRMSSEKLAGHVEFYDETATPEDYYAEADIFIHSALCAEGFGLTLVEAMAAGCICIASDRGAIPEIINSGENGFLVNPDDIHEIAMLVQKVKDTPAEEINALRKRASTSASRYSLDKYVSSIDAMIDQLMDAN